jgi:hypothetical protein
VSRFDFAFVLASLLLAGCDLTGQYEAKFKASIQRSELRALFDQRLAPGETSLTDAAKQDVGVRLRLPTYIDNSAKQLPPGEARAQPPFLKLPGLSTTYERAIDDSAGKFLPVYIYVAAVPKAEMKADALQTALSQQTAAALPGAAWGDATLPTPAGTNVTFKRLRAEGPQDFVNLQTNAVVKQDGRFDLYFIDAGAHHVLVGWRAAKGQGEKWQFPASEAAMGSVVVDQSPAAADGQPAKAGG